VVALAGTTERSSQGLGYRQDSWEKTWVRSMDVVLNVHCGSLQFGSCSTTQNQRQEGVRVGVIAHHKSGLGGIVVRVMPVRCQSRNGDLVGERAHLLSSDNDGYCDTLAGRNEIPGAYNGSCTVAEA
jgi:hypothetical protein